MDIGNSLVWSAFGRDDNEEVGLWVENEVYYENNSSVGKGVKDEFVVVFGGSVGLKKRCRQRSLEW